MFDTGWQLLSGVYLHHAVTSAGGATSLMSDLRGREDACFYSSSSLKLQRIKSFSHQLWIRKKGEDVGALNAYSTFNLMIKICSCNYFSSEVLQDLLKENVSEMMQDYQNLFWFSFRLKKTEPFASYMELFETLFWLRIHIFGHLFHRQTPSRLSF